MIPFNCSEYVISNRIELTVLDIEHLTGAVKSILDKNFVSICEGSSGTDLVTAKKEVANLYTRKDEDWKMGATAEFFVHLYLKLRGFKQECLFLNLEEGSIKKGFDGYYSLHNVEWLMESKAGAAKNTGVSHVNKVKLAMRDLEDKVAGRPKRGCTPNNPWKNAYSHASHCDVGTAANLRKNIKALADDFTNGKFHLIDEFNTIPCGTIYLSGIWTPPNHQDVFDGIQAISNILKGQKIHAICVTHKSVDLFISYINQGS